MADHATAADDAGKDKHERPEDSLQAPEYKPTRPPRQTKPSLGYLDGVPSERVPPEIISMVMEQLICIDLEVLGSCSTGAPYGRARLSPLQRTSRASTDSFFSAQEDAVG